MYHNPFFENPPAYGAPPPITLLTSLSGRWIPVIRTESIEETSPKRFRLWTTYENLKEVSVYDIFKWRLRFQICEKKDGGYSHEYYLVKMLSCGLSDSKEKDEEIYIEVEVNEREDKHGRLTDEEVAYIREL